MSKKGKFEELLNEISDEITDYHVSEFETGTLDYIFGDKKRIAEKVDGGKKFKVPIQAILSDYDIDFENWIAYKKTDTEKKQGTKINKALNNKGKQFKKQSTEDGVNPDIDKIDYLLQVHDLKSQTNALTEPLYVIYSRSPIDVVRMSDFSHMSSCHSPDSGDPSGYFKCALADSNNASAIAYLVTEGDFNTIKDLQSDEIFVDQERMIGGIEPLARIRLRVVHDGEGEQQVVPSLRVYGRKEFEKLFKEEVTEWSKRHINKEFNWDSKLTRRGGSYEDSGVSVKDMLKTIFGKDVRVDYDSTDEDDVEYTGDYEEREQEAYEQYESEYVDNLNSILEDRFTYNGLISNFEYNSNILMLEIEFNSPEELDFSLPNKTISYKDNTVINIYHDGEVTIETPYTFNINDYGNYYYNGEYMEVESENIDSLVENITDTIAEYIDIDLNLEDDDEIATSMIKFYSEHYNHIPSWFSDTLSEADYQSRHEIVNRDMSVIRLRGEDFSGYKSELGDWVENYNKKFLKTNTANAIMVLDHISKRIEEDKSINLDIVTNKLYEGMIKGMEENDLEEYDPDEVLDKQDLRNSLDVKIEVQKVANSAHIKIDLGLPTGNFDDETREYGYFDEFYEVVIGEEVDVEDMFFNMKHEVKSYFTDLFVKYATDLDYDKNQKQLDLSSFKIFLKNYQFIID